MMAIFVAASSHAQPVTAAVQQLPLEPGLWEVVTRPDVPGMPMIAMAKTDRLCLTPKDITAGKIPLRSVGQCQVQSGVWAAQRLVLKLSCGDMFSPSALSGTIAANGNTFTGTIAITEPPGQPGQMGVGLNYFHAGKWLDSTCLKP